MASKWRGPEYEGEFPSLGWQLIDIWYELFPSPRNERQPFVLTDEQALEIVGWYQIHPVTGKFVYRRGCTRKAKKTGKSPLEAAKCISELGLPVRFDGWDSYGEPVARPWGTQGDPNPWVQIASLSEDQDENTYTPLFYFLTANDARLADTLNIDAGLTRCFLRGRPDAKIEPVTSRAGSREGQPITYATLDESGLMNRQNGGQRLARTIRRNATGMGGRTYETTNGFAPGEDSVAEGTHKAVEAGTAGIFYVALEAPKEIDGVPVTEKAPDAVLRAALEVPYRGCWWSDVDRILADIRDPDMPWSDAERWFFNWNRKGEGKAVEPERWAELARPDVKVKAKTAIGVGFDGSISNDSTFLVGCTMTGFSFLLGAWERPFSSDGRPDRNWKVPRLEVHRTLRETFKTFAVLHMLADPAKWYTELEEWQEEYGEEIVEALDTNSPRRFGPVVDRWLSAIKEGTHTHRDDEPLNRHVLAAQKQKVRSTADDEDGRTLFQLVKPEDGRKMDGAIADALAYEAAMTAPAPPPKREPFVAVT